MVFQAITERHKIWSMDTIFKERPCLSARELQRYADGELSPKKAHEVEAHLLDCPLCADAVEGYTDSSFTEEDEAALRDLEAVKMPRQNQRRVKRKWINRAAAILLIITGTYAVWQYRSATRHQAIFAAFYKPFAPNYLTLRGAAATDPFREKPDLRAALEQYQAGNYVESVVFLERYLAKNPADEQAQMMMASALLGNWQAERSVQILHQLEGAEVIPDGDLYWYLVLAHVQRNQLDSARLLLEQVDFEGKRAELAVALETRLNE